MLNPLLGLVCCILGTEKFKIQNGQKAKDRKQEYFLIVKIFVG
jgi:hypothetical protein